MTIDGVAVELHHWAPAHTSGDLIVYLPAQRVAFCGDIIVTTQPDPVIHLERHGSSEGWITSVKGLLGLSADTFVSGHGDLQTKADLQTRLTAVVSKRDAIVSLIKDGKSLDEIKAAVGDPPSPGPVPGRAAAGGFATFTEVVYQEMTRR
jgi:cyclase